MRATDRRIEAGIDVTAYTVAELDEIAGCAREVGVPARVQLKVDTGLSRGGSTPELWGGLTQAAAAAEETGAVRITGVWSHLACSDEPDHPANKEQEDAFREACFVLESLGVEVEVRHLANSAAALLRPTSRFDLVRCGIASYGLSPAPEVVTAVELGLVPAMTVRGRLALVKRVPDGRRHLLRSHLHDPDRHTVGVVPLGYGDGVPRHASSRAEVQVAGARRPVRGRVCMDQLVVDLGDDDVATGRGGRAVRLRRRRRAHRPGLGRGAGTISYEIVTRFGARLGPARGGRMARVHVDSDDVDADDREGGSR